MPVEDVHNIVSHTKGYYTRDYSLWLGWNNVSDRYSCAIMDLTHYNPQQLRHIQLTYVLEFVVSNLLAQHCSNRYKKI